MRLQQLETDTTMLEVQEVKYRAADGRLFACTDLHGFEVVDASDPANMRYIANFVAPESIAKESGFGKDPPGCMHLAYDPDRVVGPTAESGPEAEPDPDVVFFSHRGNETNPSYLAAYDVAADPPAELALYQEAGVSFEGLDMAGGYVYAGLHNDGLGVFQLADGALERIATATGLENAWGVFAQGDTVFVADGPGGLATVDVSDPTAPTLLGRVATGGHARSVFVDGTTAYVGAGPAGLVVVDVADLSRPLVVGRAETPGSASQVYYSDGRVYVGAWTDARVYDVSDRTAPRMIASTRFDAQSRFGTPVQGVGDLEEGRPLVPSRTVAVAAHEDIVFVGNWHLLYSYRLHPDRLAPNLYMPDSAAWLDLGVVEPGQSSELALEVKNQGTAPLNVLQVWADDPSFSVMPTQVRVEPEASTVLTITYAPSGLEQQTAKLRILTDDPLQPVRTSGLVGNAAVTPAGSSSLC